ncbi:hypothetical protein [Roseibium sp. M-1]
MKHIGKMILLTALAAVSLIAFLSYSGFCFSEKRYFSETELYEIAVFDAYSSVFFQPGKIPPTGQDRSWEKVKEFVKSSRDCCKILYTFDDYLQSEEYRVKAGNFEGYFFPGFFGRLFGCESYLVEIRYIGTRQVYTEFDEPGPRVVYRILGACGRVL